MLPRSLDSQGGAGGEEETIFLDQGVVPGQRERFFQVWREFNLAYVPTCAQDFFAITINRVAMMAWCMEQLQVQAVLQYLMGLCRPQGMRVTK